MSNTIKLKNTPLQSNGIKLTNAPVQNIGVNNNNGVVGATDHSKLTNRDLANQHPISAITGLQEELDSLNQGVVFIPSVSDEGVISWTNNGGLTNPTPINIKGERGEQGIQGIQGVQGIQGASGVYVGTGDMPSGYNVQIDPSGTTVEYATKTEIERLKYYGDKDIVPSDESYFTVNETGETITGLTDTGKTQTELVIPYKINGIKITTINTGAFNNCSSLTLITIPNSVTSIGVSSFRLCTSLTSINIPNGVTSIGNYAFGGCSSLTLINIPNSVTSIGNSAFLNCTSLTSINIPNGVTSIGNNAFAGCTNLKIYCEQSSYADTYAKANSISVAYTAVKDIATATDLSSLQNLVGDANVLLEKRLAGDM